MNCILGPFVIAGFFLTEIAATTICHPEEGFCDESGCFVEKLCDNGICQPDGTCLCYPYYSGETCSKLEDIQPPSYFIKNEDTVYIEPSHEGIIYQPPAIDEDSFKTCLEDSSFPCQSRTLYYHIMEPHNAENSIFMIDQTTGILRLNQNAKVKEGDIFSLEIVATNDNENLSLESRIIHLYILKLTVIVKANDFIGETTMTTSILQDVSEQVSDDIKQLDLINKQEVPDITRVKRKAFSTNLLEPNLTLSITNQPPEPLKFGATIDGEVLIILPEIPSSSPISISFEIFVLDLYSQKTALALCDVKLVNIGNGEGKIYRSDGTELSVNDVNIEMKTNIELTEIYDRSIVSFGKVYNIDTFIASDGYASSSIVINFKAILLDNQLYPNDTVTITSGVEYNDEKQIWISQISYPYASTETTFPTEATLSGLNELPEGSAGQYNLNTFILLPNADVKLEVVITSEIYDMASITSLKLVRRGENHACIENEERTTFYQSVTGKSNYRAELDFSTLVKDLNFDDSFVGDSSEPGNVIEFSFTVYLLNARAGDTLPVEVMLKSPNVIWSNSISLTVTSSEVLSPTSQTSYSINPLDVSTSPPTVSKGGTATYQVTAQLDPAGYTRITCTATATAPNKVCGVGYGISGIYAASFPSLEESDFITYTGETAVEWTVDIAHAKVDGILQENQSFVAFEVTFVFNDPSLNAEINCGPPKSIITVQEGNAGLEEVSGQFETTFNDSNWYTASQIGLIATFIFPPRGVAYSNFSIVVHGTHDPISLESRICSIKMMHIGRGVGCAFKTQANIMNKIVYGKTSNTSSVENTARLDIGAICGSKVSDDPLDNELAVRIVLDVPPGQDGLEDQNLNISLGGMFGSELVWIGWNGYNFLAASTPEPDPTKAPNLSVPAAFSTKFSISSLFKFSVKTHPGSVGHYILKVTSSDSALVKICRVLPLYYGNNYACLDKQPYGKHLNPDQSIKITHNTDWGLEATIDMGIIRNLGTGTMYPLNYADEDSIVFGIVIQCLGPASIDIQLEEKGGQVYTEQTNIDTTDVPNLVSLPLELEVVGFDGTTAFYPNVLKQINISMVIPPNYVQTVYLEIINPTPSDFSLCFATVVEGGLNIPCVIPALLSGKINTNAEGQEVIKIDLSTICYFQITDNATDENIIRFRVGLLPLEDISSGSIKIILYEIPAVKLAEETFQMVASETNFKLENLSAAEVQVNLTNPDGIQVQPGQQIWEGVKILIPPGVTLPVKINVMTASINGHAQATVHGFRWGSKMGKNIACSLIEDKYDYTLIQNASLDETPMHHESQNNSLSLNLKYITNTGITYPQMIAQPEDNLLVIEVEFLIADHEDLANGDDLRIEFAIKVDKLLFTVEKSLIYTKPATSDIMILNSTLLFTDSSFDPEVPLAPGEKLYLSGQIHHVLNESTKEAYDARVYLLIPSYIQYANESSDLPLFGSTTADSLEINIPSVIRNNGALSLDIDYLFFTDNLEFNISLSVDPYGTMPKGLGVLESTAIMRLVCHPSAMANPRSFCGNTAHLNYLVQGSECYDDLNLLSFSPCQFLASTAIDENYGPMKSATPSGWRPAVRDSRSWKHHISIDFLRRVRITKIQLDPVTDTREVESFKLQISSNGVIFLDACQINLSSGFLPTECRVETRYARLVILSLKDASEETAIGISFRWFGCPLETKTGTCTFSENGTPLTTNATGWRHAAFDSDHSILYFCDYNPIKQKMVCYSTSDGSSWNVVPGYIGRLAGYDTNTQKMYAYDHDNFAMVASSDGKSWALVEKTTLDSIDLNTLANTVKVIPGYDEANFIPVTIGSWKADFLGMKLDDVYKVKWGSCCQ